MRLVIALAAVVALLGGCGPSLPSDSAQQQMAKDWSPENVAKEYEKKGMYKEAEEVRRDAQQGKQ